MPVSPILRPSKLGEAQSHGHSCGLLPSVTQHSWSQRREYSDLRLSIQRFSLGHVPILNQLPMTCGTKSRWERAMIGPRCPSWNNQSLSRGGTLWSHSLCQAFTSRSTNVAWRQYYIKIVTVPWKPYIVDANIEKGAVVPSFCRVLGRQKNNPHYHIIKGRKRTPCSKRQR